MATPSRKVTELDFRIPEFRNSVPEDYEFRADGTLVRKDRWETAVRSICGVVGLNRQDFEIDAVVEAVKVMADDRLGWRDVEDLHDAQLMPASSVSLKLVNKSVLRGAEFVSLSAGFTWEGKHFLHTVAAWRDES